MRRFLADVGIVALYEVGEAVRTRLLQLLILGYTGGIGAAASLECAGTPQAIATAFAIARPGSTVGMVGVPHGVELPLQSMFGRNVALAGGMAPVRKYLPELLDLVTSGEIDPSPVFDATLPLAEVAEGYRRMDQREAIKGLIQP